MDFSNNGDGKAKRKGKAGPIGIVGLVCLILVIFSTLGLNPHAIYTFESGKLFFYSCAIGILLVVLCCLYLKDETYHEDGGPNFIVDLLAALFGVVFFVYLAALDINRFFGSKSFVVEEMPLLQKTDWIARSRNDHGHHYGLLVEVDGHKQLIDLCFDKWKNVDPQAEYYSAQVRTGLLGFRYVSQSCD